MKKLINYSPRPEALETYTLQSGNQYYRVEIYDDSPENPQFEVLKVNGDDLDCWAYMGAEGPCKLQILRDGKVVKKITYVSYNPEYDTRDPEEYLEHLVDETVHELTILNMG